MNKLSRVILAATCASLLAACSTAPQYQQPSPAVPEKWLATDDGEGAGAELSLASTDIQWRDFFTDTGLQQLISATLEHNQDLRAAALSVEVLRARYQIERSALYPNLAIGGGSTRQRLPADLSPSGSAATSGRYDAAVGLSTYEVDFFGRVRNLSAAALETYLATEYAQRSLQTSLISEVSTAYLSWLTNRDQLKLAEATLDSYEENLNLIRQRFEGDVASSLDVTQAQTLVHQARTQVARFDRLVKQELNALAFFTGHNLPSTITESRSSIPIAMGHIEAGLPSSLLTRRSDILEAEHKLRAAYADIGAARAAFFPSITLTANAGVASSELSGLFEGGSGAWLFAPQINLPIFTGGRLKAGLEVAETTRDIRVAEYQQTVQQAFRDVADSLAARETYKVQVDAQQALVDANSEYFELAQNRYNAGVDNYLTVLDAQRQYFSARQQLLSDRFNQLAAEISLFRALGGGSHPS
ncbi:efflux transporter outer membrane subunit [Oceanisphaera sp.]|uniref:efflux transporter outer membrane subunit n=1 Tax=Oceanisphaera sp. TaxID=1929979 RepID=UPI003A90BA1D